MTLNTVAIGKRIKMIRKRNGYSQMALSEMVDCSPTYISYLENGVKSMSLTTFVKLANALHVAADEILVDNLKNTIMVSNYEFTSIFADCSEYERRALLEMVVSAKKRMRDYEHYLRLHR